MKKMKTLISTMLCLCTVCALALPASALSYDISAPGDPEYGKPTSFEPVVTADRGEMPNVDVSKNAALIPPGFGTPTSYVMYTSKYLTPDLVASQMAGTGMVSGSVVSIAPPSVSNLPNTSVEDTAAPLPSVEIGGDALTVVGFTEVTSSMYYSGGSLGTLKIPSIGLTVGYMRVPTALRCSKVRATSSVPVSGTETAVLRGIIAGCGMISARSIR